MAAPIQVIYTSAARRELRLFANWEPGRPLALGDYGRLNGDWFDRLGTITEFGMSWTPGPSGTTSHRKFTSSSSVQVTAHAKGKAAGARARIEVKFGQANAVFMDAAGCAYQSIADKRQLGDRLAAAPGFNRDWVVLTDLITAKRTTVAISTKAGASITFEATAPVQVIDLADASVGLKAGAQDAIGYIVDGEDGLSPLFGLCGFRRRFLREGFETMGLMLTDTEGRTDAPEDVSDGFVQLL
jgi:hypothetical protein